MKLCIFGSRDFTDYEIFKIVVGNYIANFGQPTEIISGMAKGADFLAVKYALVNDLKLTEFPANWSLYGKSAGMVRNQQMAVYATHFLAFWNGESKGTKNMIELVRQANKPLEINYVTTIVKVVSQNSKDRIVPIS